MTRQPKPCAWRERARYVRPIPCDDTAEYTVTVPLPNGDAVEADLCLTHLNEALTMDGVDYA